MGNDMERRIQAVLDEPNLPFSALSRLAGLHPGRHWRGANLRGVEFGDDNLHGFDFRLADLRGAKLSRAQGLRAEMFVAAVLDATTELPPALRDKLWPPRTALARWRERIPGLPEEACPDMVTLPVGQFVMGAPTTEKGSEDGERPQRKVRVLRPVAIGRCAVTFAQWDGAVAAGFSPASGAERPDDGGWGRGDRPVINVSWTDARAYCAWLTVRLGASLGRYRLPSEAEWEYACRAGTETEFSFGSTITPTQANYDGTVAYGRGKRGEYRERTVPVGSLPANGWGLHEMHGNVWEWCEDGYGPYPAARTGTAPLSYGNESPRVLRGGSWDFIPRGLRSAFRNKDATEARGNYVGFRLARSFFEEVGVEFGQAQNGTVKWFNAEKGYGFLKPDGSDKDVFVHISELQRSGLDGLNDDARVEFCMVKDSQGKLSAGHIVIIE